MAVAEQQPSMVERAELAHSLECEIMGGCSAVRAGCAGLAERLHRFHELRLWQALGYESFNEWLASPEIDLGRGQVSTLIRAHRVLTLAHDRDFGEIGVTKLQEILPAVERGVDVDEALADARALSRSDLRTKYRIERDTGEPAEYEKCSSCGQRVRVQDQEHPEGPAIGARR